MLRPADVKTEGLDLPGAGYDLTSVLVNSKIQLRLGKSDHSQHQENNCPHCYPVVDGRKKFRPHCSLLPKRKTYDGRIQDL